MDHTQYKHIHRRTNSGKEITCRWFMNDEDIQTEPIIIIKLNYTTKKSLNRLHRWQK